MPETINRNIRLGVEGGPTVEAELRQVGATGETAFKLIEAGAGSAGRSLKTFGDEAQRTSGSSRYVFGNIGAQVQDLAVQIGGGTSALRAFSQQGPQILSAFGPWGAVVGAGAAVVGALAGAVLGFNKDVKETPDLLGAMGTAMDKTAAQAKAYASMLEHANEVQKAVLRDGAKAERQLLGTEAGGLAGSAAGNDALRRRLVGQALGQAGFSPEEIASGRSGRGLEAVSTAARQANASTNQAQTNLRRRLTELATSGADNSDQELQRLAQENGLFADPVTKPGIDRLVEIARRSQVLKALQDADVPRLNEIATTGPAAQGQADRKGTSDAAATARRDATQAAADARRQQEEIARKGAADDLLIQRLGLKGAVLDDPRQGFIDSARSRLSDVADPAKIAQVQKLAAAIYDQAEAQKQAAAAQREMTQLEREGDQVTRKYGDGQAERDQELQRYRMLLQAGVIDLKTFQRAQMDLAGGALGGVTGGVLDITERYGDLGKTIREDMSQGFEAATDAAAKWATGTKVSIGEVAASLAQAGIRQSIQFGFAQLLQLGATAATAYFAAPSAGAATETAPASSALNGLLGHAHTGGVIGELSMMKPVDLRAFANARRYHMGGWPGLGPDEVPIIAQRGERVLSRDQVAAGAGQAITIHQTFNVDARGATDPAAVRAGVRAASETAKAELADELRRNPALRRKMRVR